MVSSLWIVRLSRWNTNTLLKWLGQPDGEGRCYRPGRQAGAAAEHRATRQLKTAGYAFQTANRKLWNSHLLPFPTFLRVSYETITNKPQRFPVPGQMSFSKCSANFAHRPSNPLQEVWVSPTLRK